MTCPIGGRFTGTPARHYFRQWAKQGLVQQIHDKLVTKVRLQAGRQASPSLGLIGSQSVKTMSVTTLKGYDGNKKRTARKRFIVVDVLSLVLALRLTWANVGERAGGLLLFTAPGNRFARLKAILADQGFDGVDFLTTVNDAYQLTVTVVCGVLGVKGFRVVPKRWIVEGTFDWWAFHGRLVKYYEVKESHAEAVVY